MLINRGLLFAVPTPVTTLKALWRMGGTAELYRSAGLSVLRIVIGYAAAVLVGMACGYIAHRVTVFDRLTAPVLHAIRAVPVASFIVLIFLWFHPAVIPVLISFLMVLPIVWLNTQTALKAIDPALTEMAGVMRLPRRQVWRHIVLPAVMPSLSAALTTGLGFAWKAGVSAEVICRTGHSLGNLLWTEKNAIAYDEVFALTLVIIVFSMVLERLLRLLVRRGNA